MVVENSAHGLTRKTEIRHLPAKIIQELARYLDHADKWKQLAEKIHTSIEDKTPLYTSQHISMIEKCQEGPTTTLLGDWGTHGRKRPTLDLLVNLLSDCQLHAVANYIRIDILNESPVLPNSTTELFERHFSDSNDEPNNSANGKSADFEFNLPELEVEISKTVDVLGYDYLRSITNNFDEKELKFGGHKIGVGAFSIVYLGVGGDRKYAVKRLEIEFYKAFKNEVNLLSTAFHHKNVVTLFFASISEKYLCLGYEYMTNGALQDRLSQKNEGSPIPWRRRLQIATDVSEALAYIHDQHYIHRDVKSANILLDDQWIAKLGDFGIAHIGPDRTLDQTSFMTQTVIGTHVYMPHEALYGIISDKLDTYSFGVVLLELLTGLLPLNKDTNESLTEAVAINCFEGRNIAPLLDKSGGDWDIEIANEMYGIANDCLESIREKRPTMKQVLDKIKKFQ